MKRAALLLILLAACGREDVELVGDGDGGTTPDGDPGIPGLLSLEITPSSTAIDIDDLTAIQIVDLVATGSFAGGETRNVTDQVSWGADNVAPGSFLGPGRWQTSNAAGGVVTVEARSGSISASATITVTFRPVVDDPTFPPPPGTDDLFDPTTPVVTGDPTSSPLILYPADEVMFPINVFRVLFQYRVGIGTDVYRIHFVSEFLDMKIYTTGDRWQANEVTWTFLAATNAGAKVVMTVAGVNSADPTTIWESDPIDVFFSRSAVEGAIYYWSTSSEGVMKGVLSQPTPTKFYTAPPNETCVACHTVSRDGKRMAVGYDGEKLQEIGVPDRSVTIEAGTYDMGWSTFSPDGSLLLLANKGELKLIDSDTGAPVGPSAGVLPLSGASHPDWSPQGDFVAVAVCGDSSRNKEVKDCAIGRIPYNAGGWGDVEILVPVDGTIVEDNNFFPKYSPDGNWIAYVNSVGKSKDQPTSELRLVPAAGGASIVLTVGNRRVGPDDGVVDLGNTMPTWAPSTHPGTQWLAFSSIRDYGTLLVGNKADQLWVVALDLDRAATGEDPTFASFWLPLQDVTERNHRAFWAHDADEPCTGMIEVCDEFDNDCDGVVDEGCVPCAGEETCFDGIDNDCDGVIDDGCIS